MTRRLVSDVGLGIAVAVGAVLCLFTPVASLRMFLILALWLASMLGRALYLSPNGSARTPDAVFGALGHGAVVGVVAAGTLFGVTIFLLQLMFSRF